MSEAQGSEAGQQTQEGQQAPDGFLSQETVNKIVGERVTEASTKAEEKARTQIAEMFGYDDPAELDAVAEALKAWEAENATADEQLSKTKAELKQEREARTRLEKEYGLKDALRDAGIKPERIPHALKLADFDAEPAQAVEGVKEASPEWFGRERAVAEDTTDSEPAPQDFMNMPADQFGALLEQVKQGEKIAP